MLLLIVTAVIFIFVLIVSAYLINEGPSIVSGLSVIVLMASLVGLTATGFLGFDYVASDARAQVINKMYSTQYTPKEVFFNKTLIQNHHLCETVKVPSNE